MRHKRSEMLHLTTRPKRRILWLFVIVFFLFYEFVKIRFKSYAHTHGRVDFGRLHNQQNNKVCRACAGSLKIVPLHQGAKQNRCKNITRSGIGNILTRTLDPKNASVRISACVGNESARKGDASNNNFAVADVGKLFEKLTIKISP